MIAKKEHQDHQRGKVAPFGVAPPDGVVQGRRYQEPLRVVPSLSPSSACYRKELIKRYTKGVVSETSWPVILSPFYFLCSGGISNLIGSENIKLEDGTQLGDTRCQAGGGKCHLTHVGSDMPLRSHPRSWQPPLHSRTEPARLHP